MFAGSLPSPGPPPSPFAARTYTETLEATTNIRIYGTPSKAILEVLRQTAGSGIPVTILPEHLGGFSR